MPSETISLTATGISPGALLAIYCALVMLASLAGGWLLLLIHLTHCLLYTSSPNLYQSESGFGSSDGKFWLNS